MSDMKVCPSCREPKPISEFNSQGKYCLPCHREKGRQWRLANPRKSSDANRKYHQKIAGLEETKGKQRRYAKAHYERNKARYVARNKSVTQKILRFVESIKHSGRCARCGTADYRCLVFHHLGDKKFNISEAARFSYSLTAVKSEIEKCQILCANCHLIVHALER